MTSIPRTAWRIATAFLAAATVAACAPTRPAGTTPTVGGWSAAITTADLRARVHAFAADSMMGREAPGPWNQKATDYLAAEAQRLGLEPAGENGTYFQDVLATHTVDTTASAITVGGRTFRPGRDFLPRWQGPRMRSIEGARVVHGGTWGSAATMIDSAVTAGKVVVVLVPPLPNGQPGWQANRAALTRLYANAAAIVLASLDAMPGDVRGTLGAPSASLIADDAPVAGDSVPQFLYASRALTQALVGPDPAAVPMGTPAATTHGRIVYRETPAQARNVVAVLRGSDPALRGSYVVIGAHNDHVGFTQQPVDHDSLRAFNAVVRPEGADDGAKQATAADWPRIRAILDSLRGVRPARPDSIFNGADDDASGSMAMLEIAEAMVNGPRPRRSVLFIWHTAEELGLLGAQRFAERPTVPRDSMVAMINIDMIGRGTAEDVPGGRPGYLQVIGSRRLSTALGDLVEAVNASRPADERMTFDYTFDANNHPGQYYCRSDHYHYARFGIPVVFFSSGGHRDYHMVTDEPQYIAYESLRRVTQYLHDLALTLADRAQRPAVDQPVPDPAGACVQ